MVDKFLVDAITGCDHHIDKTLTTNLLSLANSLWNRIVLEVKEIKELSLQRNSHSGVGRGFIQS